MSLKSFRVEDQKALRSASCETVPQIMVIAGANGAGKSTLLYALQTRQGTFEEEGSTQFIYQGPHRAIQRQNVQRRHLLGGALRWMTEIMSGREVSGFDGLALRGGMRSPDSLDEAGSTIKYTLGKIENRRQAVLVSLVDKARAAGTVVDPKGQPDLYEPLRSLVGSLLPHLEFRGIDFQDEDNVRCVFTRTDGVESQDLDLDDLSSGEKSIVLLFLPLVEKQLDGLLRRLEEDKSELAQPDRLFIVDEPELHLHPDLQARLLGYLREETVLSPVQVIIATHSPTLLDQAHDDELYVLKPANVAGENQLRRVATSSERLEAMKDLAGSAYVITTGRSVVCVEGVRESSKPTDTRILEILHPAASRYTFAAMGAKGNVLNAVKGLRESVSREGLGIDVFGIVDKDRTAAAPRVEGVVAWPVASIENLLLLDSLSIAAAVEELTGPAMSTDVIDARLKAIGVDMREEEIAMRVALLVGTTVIRPKGTTIEELRATVGAASSELLGKIEDPGLAVRIGEVAQVVEAALTQGTFRESFQGKVLLKKLFQGLGLAQVSYEEFTYAVARHARPCAQVRSILETVFASLDAQATAAREGVALRPNP